MMKRFLILCVPCFLLLTASDVFARPIPVNLKKTSFYDFARPGLLKNGWNPAGTKMRQLGSCDPKIDRRCNTYPEARECSGTGLAFCNMVWKHRDGTIMVITTAGDGKAIIMNVAKE